MRVTGLLPIDRSGTSSASSRSEPTGLPRLVDGFVGAPAATAAMSASACHRPRTTTKRGPAQRSQQWAAHQAVSSCISTAAATASAHKERRAFCSLAAGESAPHSAPDASGTGCMRVLVAGSTRRAAGPCPRKGRLLSTGGRDGMPITGASPASAGHPVRRSESRRTRWRVRRRAGHGRRGGAGGLRLCPSAG